jgi:predicted nucleic acid-binding protein
VTLQHAQRAVVVDASTSIEFLVGEPRWLDRWQAWIQRGDVVLAPPHLPFEVANGLLRGSPNLPADRTATLIRRLFASGLELADLGLRGLERSVKLADRHALTICDAAYLDLAIDVDGELATLDRELIAAAAAEGVEIVA